MDTSTGLLYMGSGQYYDPTTGRFLNRNAKPDQTNPYVPWGGNPTGALFAPLALLSLVYNRKKKRGTLDIIIVLVVVGAALSMSLTACGPTATVTITTTPAPTSPPTATSTPTATTVVAVNDTPVATFTAVKSPTPDECTQITMTLTSAPGQGTGYWFEFQDNWTISYYVNAREDDKYFQKQETDPNGNPFPFKIGQKGPLPGLNPSHLYDLNWAYGWKGVLTQGTGFSSYGEYVTKDWNQSTPDKIYFTYGKGGKWGPPVAWQTVASGDDRLRPKIINNKYVPKLIKISMLANCGTFAVTDIGQQVGQSHVDVFIGDQPIKTADDMGICTDCSKVSVFITQP